MSEALLEGYVDHYNNDRLNTATGYVTPKDMLAGRQQQIHTERDRKLEAARNNGRFVGSKPLNESRSSGVRKLNFRFAGNSLGTIASLSQSREG